MPAKDHAARARQDTHEKVCTERYGNIDKQLSEIKETLRAQSVQYNERFNGLSGRMWGMLIGSFGGTLVACGGLVFFLITQRHG